MWAQITQDKDALATGVIVAAATLWIANQVKSLLNKPPVKDKGPGDEPVTRGQMDEESKIILAEIDKQILAVKEVSHDKRQQLAARIDGLTKDQAEQNAASRKDIHDLRGGIHEIQLRIERQYREMDATNRKQFDEMMKRASETDIKLERIFALLEKEGKNLRHED